MNTPHSPSAPSAPLDQLPAFQFALTARQPSTACPPRLCAAAIGLSAALLSACGGGGSDANIPGPTVLLPPPPATYTIGGTISGLATESEIVLQNNGGDNLSISSNGTFSFAIPVNDGGAYNVTRFSLSNPTLSCPVTNGTGTAIANVTNVLVSCIFAGEGAP